MFFDARGWERPQWYESNAALFDRFPAGQHAAAARVGRRWWSPITNAEHLAMRDSVGMVDLTAFNEFDIEGLGRSPACSTSSSTTSTCRSASRSTRRC